MVPCTYVFSVYVSLNLQSVINICRHSYIFPSCVMSGDVLHVVEMHVYLRMVANYATWRPLIVSSTMQRNILRHAGYVLHSIMKNSPFNLLSFSPHRFSLSTGVIPAELGQLTNLENLRLTCNKLTGEVDTITVYVRNISWIISNQILIL